MKRIRRFIKLSILILDPIFDLWILGFAVWCASSEMWAEMMLAFILLELRNTKGTL